MTQLFFDIGSLANYFIAAKDKAPPPAAGKSDDDFKSCLKTLSIIGDRDLVDGQQKLAETTENEPALTRKSKAAVSPLELESWPINAAMFNAIGQVFPELPVMPNIGHDNTAPTSEMEAAMASVNSLIELIKANPPLVNLDLSGTEISFGKNEPAEIASQNQTQSPDIKAGSDSLFAGRINSALLQSIAPAIEMSEMPGSTEAFASLTRITFTADKLFSADQQPIKVNTADAQNKSAEITLPAESLKQLVSQYPAKIMVQAIIPESLKSKFIEATGDTTPQKYNSNLNSIINNNGGSSSAYDATALFDLRTLLSKHASDIVHVVIKSTAQDIGANLRPGSSSNPAKDIQPREIRNPANSADTGKDDSQLRFVNQRFNPTGRIINTARPAAIENESETNLAGRRTNYESSKRVQADERGESLASDTKEKNLSQDKPANQTVKASAEAKPGDVKPEDFARFDNQLKGRSVHQSGRGSDQISGRTPDINMIVQADKIIDQLRSRFLMTPLNSQLTIKLKPESLGRIKIDFRFEGDKIEALFRVQNPDVKTVLEAEMPRLRHQWKIDSYKIEMDSNKLQNNSSTMHNRNGYARAHGNRRLPGYRNTEFVNDGRIGRADSAISGSAGAYAIGKINLLI